MTTRMRTILAISAAVALAAGLAGAAVAAQGEGQGRGAGPRMMRPGGPGGPGGPGLRGGAVALPLARLDLSDAQRTQVRGIRETHAAALRDTGERLRTTRRALQEAIAAETFDEATVRQRSADVAAVEADMAVLRAQIHRDVFAVLTPDQQQRARELRAEAAQRFDERRERMNERRQHFEERRQRRGPGQGR